MGRSGLHPPYSHFAPACGLARASPSPCLGCRKFQGAATEATLTVPILRKTFWLFSGDQQGLGGKTGCSQRGR